MPSARQRAFYRYYSINHAVRDADVLAEFKDTNEPLSWETRANKTFTWIYNNLIERSKIRPLNKTELKVLDQAKRYLNIQ